MMKHWRWTALEVIWIVHCQTGTIWMMMIIAIIINISIIIIVVMIMVIITIIVIIIIIVMIAGDRLVAHLSTRFDHRPPARVA